MKPERKKIVPSPLTVAVGRALRRAAKLPAKRPACTERPIYIWKDGKVVAESLETG